GPAWVAEHGLTSSQYQSEFERLRGEDFRLVDVSGYAVGNEVRYATIWEKYSGPAWVAEHGLTSSQYQSEFERLRGEDFRLVDVSGYAVGNEVRYATIWEK